MIQVNINSLITSVAAMFSSVLFLGAQMYIMKEI